MEHPRVFMSFSSRDREGLRRLFARLEAQPVELWNYADKSQEVPGGRDLDLYLGQRLDRSHFLIVLITPHIFASPHARAEVAYGLERRAEGRLVVLPLVVVGAPQREAWPAPFDRLRDVRGREVDFRPSGNLEEAVAGLCRDMGVGYVPLPDTGPYLPLLVRFEKEVVSACPRREPAERAIYSRLMQVLGELAEALRAGDYPLALRRIDFFIALCEYEFPEMRFYYPYVVKGICQVSCGHLRQAAQTFEDLLDHPALDENVFGGLGYIQLQQGLFAEALASYREAARRDPSDPAAKAGILLSAVKADESFDLLQVLREIEVAPLELPQDRARIQALKGYALAAAGRLEEAERTFEAVVLGGQSTPEVIVNYAHVLADVNKPLEAIGLLERHRAASPCEHLLHLLGRLYFRVGNAAAAAAAFRDLVGRHPRVRQYRVDLAQILWSAGRHEEARAQCWTVLDPRAFPLPRTPMDFYYDGFAQWMLGRAEWAAYDFKRSAQPPDKHYRHVMQCLVR